MGRVWIQIVKSTYGYMITHFYLLFRATDKRLFVTTQTIYWNDKRIPQSSGWGPDCHDGLVSLPLVVTQPIRHQMWRTLQLIADRKRCSHCLPYQCCRCFGEGEAELQEESSWLLEHASGSIYLGWGDDIHICIAVVSDPLWLPDCMNRMRASIIWVDVGMESRWWKQGGNAGLLD